jgi:membrane-associated PAP2 superfamily phosphatase
MRLLSTYVLRIFAISGLLTAIFLYTGWEINLVSLLYDPADKFSWWMRKFGKYPAILVSVLSLVFLLVPYLHKKSPLLRRIAITWLVALIFGAGLVGGWMTVEGFDRPRPRETVLLGEDAKYTLPFIVSKEESGKSFTSGHAAMGFIFAVPFFVLRKKRPKLSYGFLAGGLLFGGVLGYTRMVLGAHFVTDVIWSAAFVLTFGALGNYLWKYEKHIKSAYIAAFLLVVASLIIYFNKFERLVTLTQTSATNIQINAKCDEFLLNSADKLSIAFTISGYGAPVENIAIQIKDGIAQINTTGFFRDLHCERGVVKVPPAKSVMISKGQMIQMGLKPPFLLQQTKTHRIFAGESVKND